MLSIQTGHPHRLVGVSGLINGIVDRAVQTTLPGSVERIQSAKNKDSRMDNKARNFVIVQIISGLINLVIMSLGWALVGTTFGGTVSAVFCAVITPGMWLFPVGALCGFVGVLPMIPRPLASNPDGFSTSRPLIAFPRAVSERLCLQPGSCIVGVDGRPPVVMRVRRRRIRPPKRKQIGRH
ncbi:MAG: hypothetical protein ACI855_004906 [Myxococcota bacterium]|jgi:hypothetical protein